MSEIIRIYDTYGINNLSSKRSIKELIKMLKLPKLNSLTVDITGCFIDYSSTSMFFDEILFHLDKLTGEKKLKIIVDYGFKFEYLCAVLFLGSKFVNISDSFKLTAVEWKQIFKELKDKNKIEIIIEDKIPVHNNV